MVWNQDYSEFYKINRHFRYSVSIPIYRVGKCGEECLINSRVDYKWKVDASNGETDLLS